MSNPSPTRSADGDRPPTDDSSDRPPAIGADDLALTYADGTEAVRDVSLSVPRGEFFGFLGPNGAGKTTTVTMLATLLRPTDGTVAINGYDASERRRAVRASIGYMAQEVSVDGELTARENLEFACEAYGVARGERAARIDDLLDLVDLADVSDTPAERFSGGMKKRLDAATALVHDPDLVFLDEPTTGLDPKARNRLWEYFERINADGTTIFLTTQYLAEADALCDRLAVIRDGTIVADGAPEDLKRRVGGEILEVEIDDDAPEDAVESAATIARESDCFCPEATVDVDGHTVSVATRRAGDRGPEYLLALRDAGIAVAGFDTDEPSLEDVFLAIADGRFDDRGPRTERSTEADA